MYFVKATVKATIKAAQIFPKIGFIFGSRFEPGKRLVS